jgi:hypothetical protein
MGHFFETPKLEFFVKQKILKQKSLEKTKILQGQFSVTQSYVHLIKTLAMHCPLFTKK